jgi:S-DNA-T family DNA segregation ATPase FtsK/SpoIIIE
VKIGDDKSLDGDEDLDDRYDDAVALVAEAKQASISMIQRRLRIGYNRAARIIEKMEQDGIIGPSDGTSRPREVFISKH